MHLDEGTIELKNFQESVIIFTEGNTCRSINSLAPYPLLWNWVAQFKRIVKITKGQVKIMEILTLITNYEITFSF